MDKKRAKDLGVSSYMIKPFDDGQLTVKMHKENANGRFLITVALANQQAISTISHGRI